jgi:polar amino acid transport system ATP-binding protein
MIGADSTTPLRLELDGVVKRYGAKTVLDGVDLTVGTHEVVCLIGSSGCGKSTLLRCIDLLDPIDEGRILLDGREISAPGVNANAVRRRIGIVFQSYNLFSHLRVIDNITLGPRRVQRVPKAEADARALEVLARLGLAEHAQDYPERLSGGQQQRVAIARALVSDPEVLLLDEITSALDPELVGEVLSAIRDLAERGMTMLLATHEMGFARQVAHRVAFLDRGHVLEAGPPSEVLVRPQHERTQQFLRRVTEAGRL